MARFGGQFVKTPYEDAYELGGSIYGGGTAPTLRLGKGFTFTRGGTGKYIVIPDVNYAFLIAQEWQTVSPAGNTYKETGSTYYNGGTAGYTGHTAGATMFASCIITVGGTPTDLPAGDELQFTLLVSRSSVL